MTKYTDDQINEAIQKAAAKKTPGPVYAWELSMYKKVIDALPEPQDDWQQCAWDDILHTDERVKAEYTSGTIIEGVPDGISDNGVYLVDGNLIPYSPDAKWYRIPAPVQHPYPLDHPAIVVIEADGYEDTNPQVFVWTGNRYENDAWSFDADDITSWKPINPAKVVADNDC